MTVGGSEGASAPLSALAVPCSVPSTPGKSRKGCFQRQACCPLWQPVFMSGWCLKMSRGWAAAGPGDILAERQLAPVSVDLLGEQRMLPRGA